MPAELINVKVNVRWIQPDVKPASMRLFWDRAGPAIRDDLVCHAGMRERV